MSSSAAPATRLVISIIDETKQKRRKHTLKRGCPEAEHGPDHEIPGRKRINLARRRDAPVRIAARRRRTGAAWARRTGASCPSS